MAYKTRARSWVPVEDDDGNPSLPSTERSVLVFLCGDRDMLADRPNDAGWGERFGFFDHDKRAWRVGGVFEGYVTHWMDLPAPPATARDKRPAHPPKKGKGADK